MAIYTIKTLTTLSRLLAVAKCGGQFVTIYAETDGLKKYNKFPTDGSERIRRDDNITLTNRFSVTYNFGTDYDKKMSEIVGEEYHAHDANRVHLVPNVLMMYLSTANACMIYINGQYRKCETLFNGHAITEDEKSYLAKYAKKASSSSPLQYRTLSVENIKEIHIKGDVYQVDIQRQVVRPVV